MSDAECKVIRHRGLIGTFVLADSRAYLPTLQDQVDLIVTSPPYADARRRHYDSVHPDDFAEWFMTFHQAFYDVLKPSGSLVINIKDKVVNGVRHRFVWHMIEKLCSSGWYAIDDYIWHKTNPMPGYWPTRLRDGWEYCFHLSKSLKPYFNADAVKKPIGRWADTRLKRLGKNDTSRHNSANDSGFGRDISSWVGKETVLPSNVLSLALVGKNKNHPAVFPVDLPLFFIKLLSPPRGIVLDPFGGSGSTGLAAFQSGRHFIYVDNNPAYFEAAHNRISTEIQTGGISSSQLYLLPDVED
jgi:site-specific DNA-methyltransferase (adenine-specific)